MGNDAVKFLTVCCRPTGKVTTRHGSDRVVATPAVFNRLKAVGIAGPIIASELAYSQYRRLTGAHTPVDQVSIDTQMRLFMGMWLVSIRCYRQF